TTAGDVTLSANTGPSGSIVDDNNDSTRITGDVVTLTAFVDIGQPLSGPAVEDIDTAANSISASTTNSPNSGTHRIWIDDLDAVTLTNVTTADGLIRITTGGSTIVTNAATAGSSPARNATIIESTGTMTVSTVSATGNITLTDNGGSIVDGNGATMNLT